MTNPFQTLTEFYTNLCYLMAEYGLAEGIYEYSDALQTWACR